MLLCLVIPVAPVSVRVLAGSTSVRQIRQENPDVPVVPTFFKMFILGVDYRLRMKLAFPMAAMDALARSGIFFALDL